MKKIYKILFIILIFVGLVVASIFASSKDDADTAVNSDDINVIYQNAQKESTNILDEEKKEFVTISVNDYLELYKDLNFSIVLVSREGCPYCEIVKPILQKVSKDYHLDIYNLITSTFTEEDKNNFLNSDIFFLNNFVTPLLMIVGDNELKDTIEGVYDYNHYVSFFIDNGVIER